MRESSASRSQGGTERRNLFKLKAVPSADNLADCGTMGLPTKRFAELRKKSSMRRAAQAGGTLIGFSRMMVDFKKIAEFNSNDC